MEENLHGNQIDNDEKKKTEEGKEKVREGGETRKGKTVKIKVGAYRGVEMNRGRMGCNIQNDGNG